MPLRPDGGGDTRVSLDVVVREYQGGADPESIVHAYPTLQLADVYAVVAYYLRNRDAVAAYLARRRVEAEALRREIEAAGHGGDGFRARLLARQARQGHASAPE